MAIAKDLYIEAYENAGMSVIKTSMERLIKGNISNYGGGQDYSIEQNAICIAIAPHLGGLFVDLWNIQEIPSHDVLNAHEGQLHGYSTSIGIAEAIDSIQASELAFIVERANLNEDEDKTALYLASQIDKIKGDMCEIIKITANEKRDAMRKFTPKPPANKPKEPKPLAPKPPGYETETDII